MSDLNYRWMPHLDGAIPVSGQGKRISTYNIALEGWRRGLNLTFYGVTEGHNELKVKYSLGNEEKTHHFSLSMGDKTTKNAFKICNNKNKTKEKLSAFNIPIPKGQVFGEKDSATNIVSYAKKIGVPLVLKPTDQNAGKGVYANIQNIEKFKELLDYERNELGYDNLIVEKFIEGNEFRVCVIEDKVIGAIWRRPASVLGNGKDTIKQLIEQKNEVRKMNPHLVNRLIKIDKEVSDNISDAGYNLNTIPKIDERVYLRNKSNLSQGGDAIDVTDVLTDELKNIALSVRRAIPGLPYYGIDMIVDLVKNTGTILEVNARPGLGGHLFPMEGQPKDLAKEIIDYYFPETRGIERSSLYFDFDSILDSLLYRSAKSVEVTNPPMGQLYAKRYIITGKVQKVGYRKWITRKAREQFLHGYTQNLKNGDVEVLVAGNREHIVNDFKDICHMGSPRSKIEIVKEYEWNKPLEIGFNIISKMTIQKDLFSEKEQIIEELKNKNKKLKDDFDGIKRKNKELLNSKSWKVTYLLRFFTAIFKKHSKPIKDNKGRYKN